MVEMQTAELLARLGERVEIVTYRQRESDYPFLNDLLRLEPLPTGASKVLWIVSWGFDVPSLLRRLRGRATAYHAHSSGYGFSLPTGVPVLAVSRNTLGYWGDRASRNPLFLVPNALSAQWLERGDRHGSGVRKIDVLVQKRKNSEYVLNTLSPLLKSKGLRVEVQTGWVNDLVGLFNSSKVVLYDSADYWRGRGVSEGFGLPPIEALACGCVVFSSLNHALADHLDPGLIGHQLGAGTLESDLAQIVAAAENPTSWRPNKSSLEALLSCCSEPPLMERWRLALSRVNDHWDRMEAGASPLSSPSRMQQQFFQRLRSMRKMSGHLGLNLSVFKQ